MGRSVDGLSEEQCKAWVEAANLPAEAFDGTVDILLNSMKHIQMVTPTSLKSTLSY